MCRSIVGRSASRRCIVITPFRRICTYIKQTESISFRGVRSVDEIDTAISFFSVVLIRVLLLRPDSIVTVHSRDGIRANFAENLFTLRFESSRQRTPLRSLIISYYRVTPKRLKRTRNADSATRAGFVSYLRGSLQTHEHCDRTRVCWRLCIIVPAALMRVPLIHGNKARFINALSVRIGFNESVGFGLKQSSQTSCS